MKTIKLLAAAFSTAALFGTLSVYAADKPTTKPADNKPAVNKICAVEGGDHTVDPEFFTIYKGMKIGFCCEDCEKSFKEDPDKYVAELKKRQDGVK